MTTVNNGVAVITGAARGQGRSHAEALAREGYDIIAIDRCADIATIPYPLATREDLDETAGLVKSFDRRVVTAVADVRSLSDLQAAITTGVDQLGDIDVVVANAGVVAVGNNLYPRPQTLLCPLATLCHAHHVPGRVPGIAAELDVDVKLPVLSANATVVTAMATSQGFNRSGSRSEPSLRHATDQADWTASSAMSWLPPDAT